MARLAAALLLSALPVAALSQAVKAPPETTTPSGLTVPQGVDPADQSAPLVLPPAAPASPAMPDKPGAGAPVGPGPDKPDLATPIPPAAPPPQAAAGPEESEAAALPDPADQPDRPDPPSRVGRLARTEGGVSYRLPEQEQWAPAQVNLPVTTGSALWTEPGGLALLQLGPHRVGLDQASALEIQRLDDDALQAVLSQGSVYLRLRRLNPGEQPRIVTPRGDVVLAAAGRYLVEAGAEDRPTRVVVYEGRAQLALEGQPPVTVTAGKAAVITGMPPTARYEAAGQPTRFVAWVQGQEPRVQPPPAVLDMTGAEDLGNYGRWQTSPEYGTIWVPQVAAGWAPYRDGRWTWVDPWGWTWVDDAPWGFAPFHYGRWVQAGPSWAWVPAPYGAGYGPPVRPVYAPALVAFFATAGRLGWLPLGPREAFFPRYRASPGYFTTLNRPHLRDVGPAAGLWAAHLRNRAPLPVVAPVGMVNRNAVFVAPVSALRGSQPLARVVQPLAPAQLGNLGPAGSLPAPGPRTVGLTGPGAARLGVAPPVVSPAAPGPNRPALAGPGAAPFAGPRPNAGPPGAAGPGPGGPAGPSGIAPFAAPPRPALPPAASSAPRFGGPSPGGTAPGFGAPGAAGGAPSGQGFGPPGGFGAGRPPLAPSGPPGSPPQFGAAPGGQPPAWNRPGGAPPLTNQSPSGAPPRFAPSGPPPNLGAGTPPGAATPPGGQSPANRFGGPPPGGFGAGMPPAGGTPPANRFGGQPPGSFGGGPPPGGFGAGTPPAGGPPPANRFGGAPPPGSFAPPAPQRFAPSGPPPVNTAPPPSAPRQFTAPPPPPVSAPRPPPQTFSAPPPSAAPRFTPPPSAPPSPPPRMSAPPPPPQPAPRPSSPPPPQRSGNPHQRN